MNDDFVISNSLSAEYDIQGVPKQQMITTTSVDSNNFRGNLGPTGALPQDKSKSINHPDGITQLNEDDSSSLPSEVRLGSQSSAEMKNIDNHLGQKSDSTMSKAKPLHNSINDTPNDALNLNPVNPSFFRGGEPSKKVDFDGKKSTGSERSDPRSTGITSNYNEPGFTEAIKSEQENLETLLKDLYAGSSKKDILSDQKMNEPYLSEFFGKYPQSKTDILAVMVAGLYLALDNLEGAQAKLARIRDPNITDDSNENAGYHRAYYIMQANLNIEENRFVEARKMLKQAYNIPQIFFTDGKESFLDFYATSMGRVNLRERRLNEAEECFKDALAQRLLAKNSRLISSSYNDLAGVYIEKREGEKALQQLNRAREYDRVFQQELENNKRYNVLLGQVDYKRPEIAKTEEAYKQLQKS